MKRYGMSLTTMWSRRGYRIVWMVVATDGSVQYASPHKRNCDQHAYSRDDPTLRVVGLWFKWPLNTLDGAENGEQHVLGHTLDTIIK